MKRMSRSTALRIAAAISFLEGIVGFIFSIPLIQRGVADINQANDTPPYFVVLASFILNVIIIVAAYGTWQNQRWGIMLILLCSAVGALLAAPGILFAPTNTLWLSSVVGVLLNVLCIVLCLWREPKSLTV